MPIRARLARVQALLRKFPLVAVPAQVDKSRGAGLATLGSEGQARDPRQRTNARAQTPSFHSNTSTKFVTPRVGEAVTKPRVRYVAPTGLDTGVWPLPGLRPSLYSFGPLGLSDTMT